VQYLEPLSHIQQVVEVTAEFKEIRLDQQDRQTPELVADLPQMVALVTCSSSLLIKQVERPQVKLLLPSMPQVLRSLLQRVVTLQLALDLVSSPASQMERVISLLPQQRILAELPLLLLLQVQLLNHG
jgi:hypothetical protein